MELPKLEDFLEGLQKSWEAVKKSIEMAKTAMKKQFDKKRQNLQGLMEGNNVWLEAKNIYCVYLNQLSKKLDQKRYRPFKISKDIVQEVFQLELLEEWAIHNIFNKTCWYNAENHNSRDNTWIQHHHWTLLIIKKNVRWKK